MKALLLAGSALAAALVLSPAPAEANGFGGFRGGHHGYRAGFHGPSHHGYRRWPGPVAAGVAHGIYGYGQVGYGYAGG